MFSGDNLGCAEMFRLLHFIPEREEPLRSQRRLEFPGTPLPRAARPCIWTRQWGKTHPNVLALGIRGSLRVVGRSGKRRSRESRPWACAGERGTAGFALLYPPLGCAYGKAGEAVT